MKGEINKFYILAREISYKFIYMQQIYMLNLSAGVATELSELLICL